MKKIWLKVSTLFLALCMITVLFAGCSGDNNGNDSNNASNSKNNNEEVSKDENDNQAEISNIVTDALNIRNEDGSYAGPLCEEVHTFTVFKASPSDFTTGTFTDSAIKNNTSYTQLKENTNIEIDFIVPASGEEEAQFNLLIASGNYPDLIVGSGSVKYPGGFDQAIDDGCFVDLTPYAQEYMPNYLNAIKASDQIYKEATTLTNKIPCAFYIYNPEYDGKELQWWGQAIRKDILDELSLNIPETISDWETALTAMKDYGVEVPYSMVDCSGMDQAFLAAYGVDAPPMNIFGEMGIYPGDDGKLTYGPLEDGYKDYLSTMNRWYENGLLDNEFMTRSWLTVSDTIYSMYGAGQIGAAYSLDGILPTMVLALQNQNSEGVTIATPAPKLDESSTAKTSINRLYCGDSSYTAITTNCEDPYLAMNFIDYLCTEEGVLLTNYGVEGVGYEFSEDGTPTFTDLIMNAETGSSDGWRLNTALALTILGQEKTRNAQFKDASIQEWDRIWTESIDQYSTVWSLTADEELEIATIMNDISTYVQEQTIKAIIDKDALDNWGSVEETLYSMNIEKALEIYQAGYDRYNLR